MTTVDGLVDTEQFIDIAKLASRPSAFAGEGFDTENPAGWNQIRVLVVGAGGLGCELLHALVLSGFADIEVIDMDTIDLTNLNRQFLFRDADVGKPKSDVAAAFVKQRYPHVNIVPHFGRIEDKDDTFYRSFHIVLLGLDSITARRWINAKYAALATYAVNEEGVLELQEATPLIDGGTEGFRGSMRHIRVGKSACFDCIDMYPPVQGVPMCTLENVPRVPEHCVLYAKEKTWDVEAPFGKAADGKTNAVDGDDPDHIVWIMEKAVARQQQFKIGGTIDFQFTQGVVKNVIPAVGFTNAMIASACVNEALKLAIGLATPMDNYAFYDGSAHGVTSYTQFLGPDEECATCRPPKMAAVSVRATPRQVLDTALVSLELHNPAGEKLQPGSSIRMAALLPTEAGIELLNLMLPTTDPRASSVAALQGVALHDTIISAAVSKGEESPDFPSIELEVSGGDLGRAVYKIVLKFDQ